MVLVVALAVFLASGAVLVSLMLRGARNRPDALGPGALIVDQGRSPDPALPDPGVAQLSLPEFTMTAQDGRTITRADLAGKVTIVDFIFTHCPFVCPMLTENMKGLSNVLTGTEVRFLSVTVDPERDTPARLAEYAKLHEADTSRWTFATTGDAPTVRRILAGSLKFAVEDDPKNPITLPDGSTMNNIVHPSWYLLVGPDARPLGLYRSSDPAERQALADRARVLASRTPAG